MTENFNILVHKLNSFKLRYYLYQLLKGVILSFFILLVMFVLFSLVEYFIYLPSVYRKFIFYGFTVFGFLLFIQFITVPLLKLLHILKPLDTKSASFIIQQNFEGINDKLLNIIELASISGHEYSHDIVLASIDQKIEELKIFDFKEAVQFKNLRKILLFLLISILITSFLFLFKRSMFTESTQRIIHYNTQFIKPAPYTFQLLNSTLLAKKGESFTFKLKCDGDEIPQLVYINMEGNNYLMKNVASGQFEFEIASLINPVNFYFTDLKYQSDKFYLNLLPKPGITSFSVAVFPPVYTGLPNLSMNNIGDLQIPNGSKIEWNFTGIDTDSLSLVFSDSLKIFARKEKNNFLAESHFFKTHKYNVFIQNKLTEPELALSYRIDIIPDFFPEINIIQVADSFQLTRFFFKGLIGDDYGFSDLKFHFNIDNNDSTVSIPFVKSLTDQEFYYSFDFNDLPYREGIVSYYFSVTDNDVVNHFKTTTSGSFTFEFPDSNEISQAEKEKFDNLQNMIEESRNMAGEIQNDLKNIQIKNMDSNVSEWEKSQMVNDILSKQNRLEQLYEQIKQDNENLNNYLNSFTQQNQNIIEKQKQIEELLNEVFTDELKKLMEEFNKLAEQFDSKKLNQLSKQMDLTLDDLQKQLDRNLEMLRKMKIEEKLNQIVDEIEKIANEHEQLSGQLEKERNFDEIKEKVTNHQNELKQLQNDLNGVLELNNELKKPLNFDDFDDDFKNIDKSIDENKSELDKKNRNKSEDGIKNTSNQLKNLAFSMNQMLKQNNSQQSMENIENLKQILSNLMLLSFSQEEILIALTGIDSNDPTLNQINLDQKRITDQSKIVKDSLYALAMRTPQINSMINNELISMELNLEKVRENLEDALFPNARMNQQFVITAVNNLALLLNEALENLEKQMADGMEGDQECENPGSGKPGMNMLKETSENIKQQLQKMIEQMKNGKSGPMSQQLGESLMQHEMMQQMLRDLMNNGSVGSDAKSQLQKIDQLLEQNRRELMNKTINSQTITRQNLITTRLLEAEKAEMEREFENKRESESATDFYSNPVNFFEYKEKDNFSIEYLNKNSHQLNNFYNYIYKQYLQNMEK